MAVNPYKQYKTTSIQTASQGRLIAMLFEGAIKFMNFFIEAVHTGKIELAHENSMKAQRIMTELILALDHSKGGDVSRAIEAAYDDIRTRMVISNIRKDPVLAAAVIKDLDSFRETWSKVFKEVDVASPPAMQAGVSIKT